MELKPDFAAVQICTGLGAGNYGDDFMAAAFWNHLRPGVRLIVEAFKHYRDIGLRYPTQHRYDDASAHQDLGRYSLPGLAVGATVVSERLGLEWPLGALTRRVSNFHSRSLPVHFLAVGVDHLTMPAARELFARTLLDAASWSVRSDRSRLALLDLGVAAERIAVGADWSWLYQPAAIRRDWAAGVWNSLGVELDRPLIVVNVVNEIWAERTDIKLELAKALDGLAGHGFQIAFFCNEVRPGKFYDHCAAITTQGLMSRRSVLVPPGRHDLDEILGLLSHATLTISQRYHFTAATVIAGSVPISIPRGDKMEEQLEDLHLSSPGSMEDLDSDRLLRFTLDLQTHRATTRVKLEERQRVLRERAKLNLKFVSDMSALNES